MNHDGMLEISGPHWKLHQLCWYSGVLAGRIRRQRYDWDRYALQARAVVADAVVGEVTRRVIGQQQLTFTVTDNPGPISDVPLNMN